MLILLQKFAWIHKHNLTKIFYYYNININILLISSSSYSVFMMMMMMIQRMYKEMYIGTFLCWGIGLSLSKVILNWYRFRSASQEASPGLWDFLNLFAKLYLKFTMSCLVRKTVKETMCVKFPSSLASLGTSHKPDSWEADLSRYQFSYYFRQWQCQWYKIVTR